MTADAILFVWGKVHGGCFEWEAIRGGPLDGAREMWRGFSSACVERCSSRRTNQGGQPTVQGLGIPIHPDIVGAGIVEIHDITERDDSGCVRYLSFARARSRWSRLPVASAAKTWARAAVTGMPDAVLETGVPLTCAADVGCEQSVEYWTSTATGDWSPRAPHLSVVELRRYVEETKRAVLNGEVMYYVAL